MAKIPIKIAQQKSYYQKKPEEFIFKRKMRYTLRRLARISQIILAIASLIIFTWVAIGDNSEYVKKVFNKKMTEFLNENGYGFKELEITGNKIVTIDEIKEKIFYNYDPLPPILMIDIGLLKTSLEEIGWVERAEIRRKLPNSLYINIIESKPNAIWQSGGEVWLSNSEGKLISKVISNTFKNLPVIVGKDPKTEIKELFDIIELEPKLMKLVSNASRQGNRRWDITFTNGIKVKLPEIDPEKSWEKLAKIDKKDKILEKEIKYIDMRIENKMVIGK